MPNPTIGGPVKRGGVTVEATDDGRLIHKFRQSTISELDICPERGRLTMTGEMPRIETDAASLGTAAHLGIEMALHALTDEGPLSPDQIAEISINEFDRLAALPNFEWKNYVSPQRPHAYLERIAQVFHDEIYHEIDPIGIEIPFDNLTIHEDDQRIIRIEGTMDLLCRNLGAGDWKTAGDERKFKPGFGGDAWQLERWAVQPTVYIQALLLMGLIDPDQAEWFFTYFAFALKPKLEVELQRLTVARHQGDLDWLVQKTISYAKLVEAELSEWPKQDNHALCSEKWAPCWELCKGRHYEAGWPRPSAPSGYGHDGNMAGTVVAINNN